MRPLLISLLCALAFGTNLDAQSTVYQGKTITIVQGRNAGGSGDFRVRAVAPFLQKYIPGNPTIAHEYMDGGGGRKATNHIFNTARPDGLTRQIPCDPEVAHIFKKLVGSGPMPAR